MALTLTHSTEMMENRLQAELISPQHKFEVLQAQDGHALLFSMGDDNVLYLAEEKSGQSHTGWTRHDLSSALIAHAFADQGGATVRTFEANQNVGDETLGIAAAISAGGKDHLFVSLGNSNADTSWAASPSWTGYPFDAAATHPGTIEIVRIFFAETTGAHQYIIVDIVRDPTSAVKNVMRFYIDPSKATGAHWVKHDLPIDIEVDAYQSCVGQVPGGYVDGVYTAGAVNGVGQLAYIPILNAFGDGPPLPTRLSMPGGAVPSAMASSRKDDLTTDLFAVSGKKLFLFRAEDQKDEGKPIQLADLDILGGTRKLIAMEHGSVTTLWGRNASDEVYYLSAKTKDMATPDAWSLPVPIANGIEKISAFLNRKDGGNTIFASGSGKLQRLLQDSHTASKRWQAHRIKLPAPVTRTSMKLNSYTTVIKLADEDDLPAAGATLQIGATTRAPVYINGTYYVLGPAPSHVKADAFGIVTVIDATDDLNGTVLKVATGNGAIVTINPMDGAFQKVATLNTGDKLAQAKMPTEDGPGAPLLPPGTSSDARDAAARALGTLHTVFSKTDAAKPAHHLGPVTPNGKPPPKFAHAKHLAPGDLFRWLKHAAAHVIHIIEDSKIWHFIAEIAGEAFHAVLDTVDAVVGAAEWVFKKVETGIKKIIDFVKLIFNWKDFRRTKDVLHNTIRRYLESEINGIEDTKKAFDSYIGAAEEKVATLTGNTDWNKLGEHAHKHPRKMGKNPVQHANPESHHLSHHFQNHAAQVTAEGLADIGDSAHDSMADLLTGLANSIHEAGRSLEPAFERLEALIQDFKSLTLAQFLERLVGVVVNAGLSVVQLVVDAIFEIVRALGSVFLKAFDGRVHIPIISDLLKDIGIKQISFLDLICWIGAVPVTVIYKVIHKQAPFPDTRATQLLSDARSWDEIEGFYSVRKSLSAASNVEVSNEIAKDVLFSAFQLMSSVTTLANSYVSFQDVVWDGRGGLFAKPAFYLSIVSAGSIIMSTRMFPQGAVKNKTARAVGIAAGGLRFVAKTYFSGAFQRQIEDGKLLENLKRIKLKPDALNCKDERGPGAIVDVLFVIPGLYVSVTHFVELAEAPASKQRSTAILGETAVAVSYIERIAKMSAINDPDPVTRLVPAGVMSAADIGISGLQAAAAFVHPINPDD